MPVPFLVIALIALAAFLAIGALLVLAMFFETRRKTLSYITPGSQKSGVSRRKSVA